LVLEGVIAMPIVMNRKNTLWSLRPSGSNWDPAQAVRWSAVVGRDRGFVPLGTLLQDARQGVFSGSLDGGDVTVRAVRVSDIHPLLVGGGESRRMSDKLARRHIAAEGDVLVARMGRLGQASCVTNGSSLIVPRDSVLVAIPKRSQWGPAIAAALSTRHVRSWLAELFMGSRAASLTLEQLGEIPVPDPHEFDFAAVGELIDRAGQLMSDARLQVEHVRGEVGIVLEDAPTEALSQLTFWVEDIDTLRAWSWQDVERYSVRRTGRLRVRSLQRLADAVDLPGHRAKTQVLTQKPNFTIDSDHLREDWYLALPVRRAGEGSAELSPLGKRYFAIETEALLVPTVGNITAAPVVVPRSVIDDAQQPLMVSISWLPLIGLSYLRSLAVVLDHPFLQLQRRLGSAFSTVAHITRDEVETLLVPTIATETLDRWESLLRAAQDQFIEAECLARRAVETVEEWYA
jgi:hypothetical protein